MELSIQYFSKSRKSLISVRQCRESLSSNNKYSTVHRNLNVFLLTLTGICLRKIGSFWHLILYILLGKDLEYSRWVQCLPTYGNVVKQRTCKF